MKHSLIDSDPSFVDEETGDQGQQGAQSRLPNDLETGIPICCSECALFYRVAVSYPSAWRRCPGSVQAACVGVPSEDRDFLLAGR